jgi:hypothetical protein
MVDIGFLEEDYSSEWAFPSPAMMRFGFVSIKPNVGCTNHSQLAIFKSSATLIF